MEWKKNTCSLPFLYIQFYNKHNGQLVRKMESKKGTHITKFTRLLPTKIIALLLPAALLV